MYAAGYIRVSTEQQKEEGSHQNQRDRLKEWADRNGHELTIYEDIAISGQSDDREAYQELMDEVAGYDAVVVRELSRFGRSLQQVLNDVDALQDSDTDFISIEDNFETQSAQGKLLFQIIGAFNEFWANLARERAQESIERRREEGKPIGRPKKLNEEQLEQVYEWREMGLSYGDIAALVEDGYGVSVDSSTIYRYCSENEEAEPAT
jgi:DNA invertase Pin-like site-specific DNA recombinase